MATMFTNTSVMIINEFWFIPIDILKLICTVFAIIISIAFLLIIIFDKTCHTIPMLLVANSCLAELVFGSDMFGMILFTLQNDLQQIYFYDSLCLFRGYMSYMSTGIQNYSYLLQAIYRYVLIMYPTQLLYQSFKFQLFIICLSWICGIIYPIPIVFTDQIKYHEDSHICQMPFRLSFLTIFNVTYLYLIPMGAIVLIYFKMVRYVHEMSKRVTPVNTLSRAQRELMMIRRIIILISILIALGLPYTVFIFISFFTQPPKYHFRIAYLFVDVSLALVLITLFQITEPLKSSIKKRINNRPTTIMPTMT